MNNEIWCKLTCVTKLHKIIINYFLRLIFIHSDIQSLIQ